MSDPAVGEALQARLRTLTRYEIDRPLGSGAFGVVVLARDLGRDRRVALKTLSGADPESLKEEFRIVADVYHPNLVTIYELLSVGDLAVLVMELLEGPDIVRAARDEGCAPAGFRRLFAEAAEALACLHRHGIVHRDIKPANVLTDDKGRAVVVDFGLARHRVAPDDGEVGGTLAYIAPEVLLHGPATTASDWYAFGTLLFQGLTGGTPYGEGQRGTVAKLASDAPAPTGALADALPDLAALCGRLLRRDPRDRAEAPEILRILRGDVADRPADDEATPPTVLLGRDVELSTLERSLDATDRGSARAVLISGVSGIGKSELANAFVRRNAARAYVLAGRYYEREVGSFKAIDQIAQALADLLKTATEARLRALLPPEIRDVARAFPALEPLADRVGAPPVPVYDPAEGLVRASHGLSRLLVRLSAERPIVVRLEDAQWADPDSVRLLAFLAAATRDARLLFLATARPEPAEGWPLAKAFAQAIPYARLPLSPLSGEVAAAIARTLLDEGAEGEADRARIAVESEGIPLLVRALALDARARRTGSDDEHTLGRLVERRLAQVPPGAVALLELAAVASEPVRLGTVLATGAVTGDPDHLLGGLRAGDLVRTHGPRREDAIECFHDATRRCVLDRMSSARRAECHLLLARAFESTGEDRPEAMALHYHSGGDDERAAVHAEVAAERADRMLAFDAAATLWRNTLAWGRPSGERRERVLLELGQALANAGRPAEAGEAFALASVESRPEDVDDRRRRSAEQYLVGGHIVEGESVLAPLFARHGLRYPRSSIGGLVLVFWELARLRIRWRGLLARPAAEAAPVVRTRLDLLWSAARGLVAVDPFRGGYFLLKAAREALDAGVRFDAAKNLALLAGAIMAPAGGRLAAWGAEMVTWAATVAEQRDDVYLRAVVSLGRSHHALQSGKWKPALRAAEEGAAALRVHPVGVTWERIIGYMAGFRALEELGLFAELDDESRLAATGIADKGDLYGGATSVLFSAMARLAIGDVQGARSAADDVLATWKERPGFPIQRFYGERVHVLADLAEGVPAAGEERLLAMEGPARRAGFMQGMVTRTDWRLLEARLGLAGGPRSRARLPRVLRDLQREQRPDIHAWVLLFRGLTPEASASDGARLCTEAAEAFTRLDMRGAAALATARSAQRRGDGAAADLAMGALSAMGADGATWGRMVAPPAYENSTGTGANPR